MELNEEFLKARRRWLVTGAAGFIGSSLVEKLLQLDQEVVGLDNFATGDPANLADVSAAVGDEAWARFRFIEADIRESKSCQGACDGVNVVLHQAALGSVPRSVADPLTTSRVNVEGFLNVLIAARDAGVDRFVYASSSSVYGSDTSLPKKEHLVGEPLSPYAVSKRTNEFYAAVFAQLYGIDCIGLRYFNVFGRRQSPSGAYAAVIPRWIGAFLRRERPTINGDGTITRDFCYIDNVVQANLLAAFCRNSAALNRVYNIAYGIRSDLRTLCELIRRHLSEYDARIAQVEPIFAPPRPGDIAHSLADITSAKELLDYQPEFSMADGIALTTKWYAARAASPAAAARV